ncbi:MAG: hypothetical protein PVG49_13595 [Desulfobacteraceae bacterium]
MMEAGAVDYQAWKFWVEIGQWTFNVIVAGYLWSSRRHVATTKRVDTAHERIDCVEKDVIELRGRIDQQPNQKQFEALGRDIRSLTSKLGKVEGRLEGINRVADLMNEHLINRGGTGS